MYVYFCAKCNNLECYEDVSGKHVCSYCGQELLPVMVSDVQWNSMSENQMRDIIERTINRKNSTSTISGVRTPEENKRIEEATKSMEAKIAARNQRNDSKSTAIPELEKMLDYMKKENKPPQALEGFKEMYKQNPKYAVAFFKKQYPKYGVERIDAVSKNDETSATSGVAKSILYEEKTASPKVKKDRTPIYVLGGVAAVIVIVFVIAGLTSNKKNVASSTASSSSKSAVSTTTASSLPTTTATSSYKTTSQTSAKSIEQYCDADGCTKEGTHYVRGLDGLPEYYCTTHYDEINDILDMMETDVGNGSASQRKCEASGCNKEGTRAVDGFGGVEYYCTQHYNEINDMISKMESDVGKGTASKHQCEECSKEGTHQLEGLGGTEYYCSQHYQEIMDIMDALGL